MNIFTAHTEVQGVTYSDFVTVAYSVDQIKPTTDLPVKKPGSNASFFSGKKTLCGVWFARKRGLDFRSVRLPIGR